MSSATVTEFYGLTQYIGTDKPSFTDNNEAFQKVDEDLHEVVRNSSSQAETISGIQESVGSLGDRVTAVEGDVDDAEIAIGALQNKETLQDNAIAALKTAALDMICAYNEAAAQSTHAYAIGNYFRYNDVLYKATAAIGIDDTIVPNVNCTATNVTEELLAIISAGATDVTARAAIEALTLEVGALANLTTTDKTSIVNAINEVVSGLVKKADYLSNSNYTELNASILYNSSYTAPANGTYLINISGNMSGAPKLYIDSGRTKEIASYYADSQTYDVTVTIPLKQGSTIYTRDNSNTQYVVKGYYAG